MTSDPPPDQPPSSPAAPAQRRGGLLPWVVAAVLGVVALVLGILLVLGEDEVGSSAESSAAAACDLLEEVDADVLEDGPSDGDQNAVSTLNYRVSSAYSLAMLAEEQDADLAGDLAESLNEVRAVLSRFGSSSNPDFGDVVDDALEECDDL